MNLSKSYGLSGRAQIRAARLRSKAAAIGEYEHQIKVRPKASGETRRKWLKTVGQ